MYCSLNEAWGDINLNSKQNDISDIINTDINENKIENFTNNNLIENFTNNSIENSKNDFDDQTCKLLVDKVLSSKKCTDMIKNKINLNNSFSNLLNENTDVVILIIIIVIIILFLDLISHIFKKN